MAQASGPQANQGSENETSAGETQQDVWTRSTTEGSTSSVIVVSTRNHHSILGAAAPREAFAAIEPPVPSRQRQHQSWAHGPGIARRPRSGAITGVTRQAATVINGRHTMAEGETGQWPRSIPRPMETQRPPPMQTYRRPRRPLRRQSCEKRGAAR
jgi:hypothetical protein